MINLFYTIRRKGLIESVYYGFYYLWRGFISKIKICWLRLRGFNLNYTMTLRGDSIFIQSYKDSIRIGKKVDIGQYVKIGTGFNGSINIGDGVGIYDYGYIDIQNKLEIGENTLIAPFCYITDYDHIIKDKNKPIIKQGYISKPIIIGKNVWLGAKVIVLKGVTIGDNTVIGAGSIVTRDIPPNSIAVGNPARVIRKIVSS